MKLEYQCPDCGKDLYGDFGESVFCDHCQKTFTTDWDYFGEEYDISCWIVSEVEED